jgi:hypothetical protein
MAADSAQIHDLKAKLERLEEGLKKLIDTTQRDLDVARELQKILFKDSLAIQGLEVKSRYVAANQMHAEFFDLISVGQGREVYWVGSWTENFGLGSLLSQALLRIQTLELANRSGTSVEDMFTELSMSLARTNKEGHYRLFVARFDTLKLQITGLSAGSMPLLMRRMDRNQLGPLEFAASAIRTDWPSDGFLDTVYSSAPATVSEAYAFHLTVPPGSRLFYLGSQWCEDLEPYEILEALDATKLESDSSLLDDLNHLLIHIETHAKEAKTLVDAAAVALRVEATKLHLA